MGRLLLAFRAFFAIVFHADVAGRVATALDAEPAPTLPAPAPAAVAPAAPKKPARSEALTLLATLQREARLIDFLMEPIAEYSDQQVGAAVRDIHRDSAAVVKRLFDLTPLAEQAEGAMLEVPAGFSAHAFHLTGNVAGSGPYCGIISHHGWRATRCELPSWNGDAEAAVIVAPVEVEVR